MRRGSGLIWTVSGWNNHPAEMGIALSSSPWKWSRNKNNPFHLALHRYRYTRSPIVLPPCAQHLLVVVGSIPRGPRSYLSPGRPSMKHTVSSGPYNPDAVHQCLVRVPWVVGLSGSILICSIRYVLHEGKNELSLIITCLLSITFQLFSDLIDYQIVRGNIGCIVSGLFLVGVIPIDSGRMMSLLPSILYPNCKGTPMSTIPYNCQN